MTAATCLVGLAMIAQGPPRVATAAESVTLRDGKVILGQLVDSADRRGPLVMLVRREWAARNLPDRAAAWEKAEAPIVARAEAQRRDRLAAWRRDRLGQAAEGDRISAWLERELARPVDRVGAGAVTAKAPLMAVNLGRTEVRAIERRPRAAARMLRLGWLSGFTDVETMATADLAQALEGRGFAPDLETTVSVESLLPLRPETDAHWLARRAATELANDPGGRFLRYQGLLLPEPAAGEPPPAGATLEAAAATIKNLLGETPVDPLPAKLRDLAARGRVGAVVTQMDLAADLATVTVRATVWVRIGRDQWTPALARAATANPDARPADAGANAGLADDPQVKAAFGVIEGLGFGEIPAEFKQRSLNMGAATLRALGEARAGLDKELSPLVLSLEAAREPKSEPKGR